MKQLNLFAGILGVFFLAAAAIHVFAPAGTFAFTAWTDLLPVTAALIAVIAGFYTYSIHGWKSTQGKVWLTLTAGIFCWFLGELIWFVYEVVLKISVPFPSLADAAWLIGYPLIFASLILLWRTTGSRLSNRQILFIFIATLLAALASGYVLLGPIAASTQISSTEKFLDLAYPVGDLMIIFGALVVPFVFGRGILSRSWSIIALGFFASAIADTLFSYLTWHGIFFTAGNIFISAAANLLWILGYLVIAFGFYHQRWLLEGASHK